MEARLSALETKTAVLETRINTMQGDHTEMVALMKEHNEEMKKQNADIHAIRERIASEKGGNEVLWKAAMLLGIPGIIGGVIVAAAHSLWR